MLWEKALKKSSKLGGGTDPDRVVRRLLDDGSVQCLEDDRHKIVTFGAFDLLKSLDVIVLRAVHDREDLGDEACFTAGPLARGTVIS